MNEINFQPVFDYIDKSMRVHLQDLFLGIDSEFNLLKKELGNLSYQIGELHKEVHIYIGISECPKGLVSDKVKT